MSSNNTGLSLNLGAMDRANWKPRNTILVQCWRHACCKLCWSAHLWFLVVWYCSKTWSSSSNNLLSSRIWLRCDTRSSRILVICSSLEGWYAMGWSLYILTCNSNILHSRPYWVCPCLATSVLHHPVVISGSKNLVGTLTAWMAASASRLALLAE